MTVRLMFYLKRRISAWSASALDKINFKRKLIQLYSALLCNAYLKGFINGRIYRGDFKFLCSPGLNCYSCPAAVMACPLGALQNALNNLNYKIGWYVLGIIMLYGVMLGRSICGWLCPVGLMQDLLYKIKSFKIKKSKFTRWLSYLKYFILIYLVILTPLYYTVPGFCKYICPAGTLSALALLANSNNNKLFNMLGFLFANKFIILIALSLACVVCYRFFCRFICPLGAIYSLFNKFNIIGVKLDNNKCVNCNACVNFCKLDIKHVGDHECINCGECVKTCNYNAINFSLINLNKRAALAFALIILFSSLIYFNF